MYAFVFPIKHSFGGKKSQMLSYKNDNLIV